MRLLITGASGFVGGHMIAHITKHMPGVEVVGTHGPHSASSFIGNTPLLPCDLTVQSSVESVVNALCPTHVIHLAGYASGAGIDSDTIHRINSQGTEFLLEAISQLPHARTDVVLVSSGYVYGNTPDSPGSDETATMVPVGAYAASKAHMEIMAQSFATDRLRIRIARSFNHTGPGQTTSYVVPALARQLAAIERGTEPPIVRVGNLDAVRDFLCVQDVVDAYARMLMIDEPFGIINISSGVGVTIRSLLDCLLAQTRVNVAVEVDPDRLRPSDVAICVGNAARAERLLGWRASRSADSMLVDVFDYWRKVVGQGG